MTDQVDQDKAFYSEFRNNLDQLRAWIDELETLTMQGNFGSQEALSAGLCCINAQCELVSFMYTNTNESYRKYLEAAMKVVPRLAMTAEGTNSDPHLYFGKYFYEIVKDDSGKIVQLVDLTETLRYTTGATDRRYKFVQVVDGCPAVMFEEKDILISDRKLQ
jgi:hypothetical protein